MISFSQQAQASLGEDVSEQIPKMHQFGGFNTHYVDTNTMFVDLTNIRAQCYSTEYILTRSQPDKIEYLIYVLFYF